MRDVLLCTSLSVTALCACSTPDEATGWLIIFDTSDAGDARVFDALRVEIEWEGGSFEKNYRASPGQSSLGVASRRGRDVSLVLSATASAGGTAFDVRRVAIEGIPTDQQVKRTVTFDGVCGAEARANPGGADAAAPCSPEGPCPEACELLWVWPPGAAPDGASDSGGDSPRGASARDSASDSVSDAASDSAGSSGGVFPGDAGSDAQMDATPMPPSPADGDGESDGDGGGEAPPACEPGALRCAGNVPERCDADAGAWVQASECDPNAAHCVAGACRPLPPSCLAGWGGGGFDCGEDGGVDCCAAAVVPGGSFLRDPSDAGAAASVTTVSTFVLDTFEVTLGRFLGFVDVVTNDGGWSPAPRSGRHEHLRDGGGLSNALAPDGGPEVERGWDGAWGAFLQTDRAAWWSDVWNCGSERFSVWADPYGRVAGVGPYRPINCVTWYEAYAFCIWDGGFLPTEAEWSLAAMGGAELRPYPWGSTDPGEDTALAVYDCDFGGGSGPGTCSGVANIAPVGRALRGSGPWGHADLAGNVAEWTLDTFAPYVPCSDCLSWTSGDWVNRGGAYDSPSSILRNTARSSASRDTRSPGLGFRCARMP